MSIILSVEGILADLANGLTRKNSDKNYNEEVGSIQEKYDLQNSDIDLLFKEPRLKGARVTPKKKVAWVLVDTESEKEEIQTESQGSIEELPSAIESESTSIPAATTEADEEFSTTEMVTEEPLF